MPFGLHIKEVGHLGILEKINSPDDVKALSAEELPQLCEELRKFVIETVAQTGGHLASNLGAVELTVAIHRVFDTTRDRLVFDVGHQSYVHKILTGRRDRFDTLRSCGGVAGFPKPCESVHDAFIAGHASNSVSVALGMARARTLLREDYSVIALIGDGALTGGMSYEGLNDAGGSQEPLIVILNDNGMSIKSNVGGVARYLARERLRPSYTSFKVWYRKLMSKTAAGRAVYRVTHRMKDALKRAILRSNMFEDMGLAYAGPVDGHDVKELEQALTWAKNYGAPVVVHVNTKKGKGCSYAEEAPDRYHGVSGFDAQTGELLPPSETFSDVFGDKLTELAERDPRVCAVTAAMESGTGLAGFAERFPDRFFDVGIAEEHAAAMSAGLAARGMIPVFAVYSTFLQRSYDMLLHDVAIGGHHVVFCVDRAGLVGEDGETHHGLFDVAFLSSVPGMTVLCPAGFAELCDMLEKAVYEIKGPVAVRYPRGGEGRYRDDGADTSRVLRSGGGVTAVTYGTTVNQVLDAADMLNEEGISVEVIKLGAVAPIEFCDIERSLTETKKLVVIEECVEQGGAGERIAAEAELRGIRLDAVRLLNVGRGFVTHGSAAELRKLCGLDAESVAEALREVAGNG